MYYLVSYDLKGASREDYDELEKTLNKMDGESILESVWILYRKNVSAESIVKRLSMKINEDRGDQLVAVCFGNDLSTQRFAGTGLGTEIHVLKKLKKVH